MYISCNHNEDEPFLLVLRSLNYLLCHSKHKYIPVDTFVWIMQRTENRSFKPMEILQPKIFDHASKQLRTVKPPVNVGYQE